MEQRQVTLFDQLNTYGLYGLITVVSTYLMAKISKYVFHFFGKGLLSEHKRYIREEAAVMFQDVKDDIQKVEKDVKDVFEKVEKLERKQHGVIAKNEGVLNKVLDTALELDKKLNEKTIINIPSSKRKG
jgi:vacuolar-type H+-ATPase subunit F/Vma7